MTPPFRSPRSPYGLRNAFLLALGCLIVWPNTFVGTRPCVGVKHCFKCFDFRTVPRAFPATGQDSGQKSILWIKVKGGKVPIDVEIAGLNNVASLVRKVRTLLPRKFSEVDEDDVCLYLNEGAKGQGEEPLRPDMFLSDLLTLTGDTGLTAETALYVDFPDPLPSRRTEDAASLRVLTPDDFVLNLKECKRPKTIIDRVGMIGVQECVRECFGHVERWLPAESATASDRVPPVMLSRCMRGGKTTILCATFDRLQAEGYNPIFVSFNGDFNIKQLPREVDAIDTLIRAIGIALMKSPPQEEEKEMVVCSRATLREYLSGKDKVVLVIDELNLLLKLGGGDGDRHASVGAFLRTTFLDCPGRYLIFSTHLPRTAGIDELLGYGSGSFRDPIALTMPTSNDLTALRNMAPECRALTGCEAAYFSFIPALIYTAKTCPHFKFKSRFDIIEPKPPVDDEFIAAFLSEFFAGTRDSPSPLGMFDMLTSMDETTQRWVLGYAGLMCNWIATHSEHNIFSEVGRLINNLKVMQESTGSGKEWETICQIAILLRSLQPKFCFGVDPLLQILNQERPRAVYYRTALSTSVTQEKADWLQYCEVQAAAIRYPHLVMLAPQSNQFPTYDILLFYRASSTAPMQVIGYQCKMRKDKKPKDPSPETQHSVLLCGRTPDQVSGWVCPNEEEVRRFLGSSLEGNYPRAWAK